MSSPLFLCVWTDFCHGPTFLFPFLFLLFQMWMWIVWSWFRDEDDDELGTCCLFFFFTFLSSARVGRSFENRDRQTTSISHYLSSYHIYVVHITIPLPSFPFTLNCISPSHFVFVFNSLSLSSNSIFFYFFFYYSEIISDERTTCDGSISCFL